MADMKHPGIKGKVTFEIGGSVSVKEFTLPIKMNIDFDKASSVATLKVSKTEFTENIDKLMDWIKAFPSELENS